MIRNDRRHQPPFQLGILLLIYNMFGSIGITNIPPVTIATVAFQMAIFLGYVDLGFGPVDKTCLNAHMIMERGEVWRIFTAAVEHGHDLHLFYNMITLVYRGRALEKALGSLKFAFLIAFFIILCGSVQVMMSLVASEIFQDLAYMRQCSVGFSGVLFALKVVLNHYVRNPEERTQFFGLNVPLKLSIWLELLVIQLISPNTSFLGHLSGILSGLLYVYGISTVIAFFSPIGLVFTYPATTAVCLGLCAVQFEWVEKPWTTKHLWSSGTSLVCLSASHIVSMKKWLRLISGPLEHASEVHFMLCLGSLICKCHKLEKLKGSLKTLALIISSLVCTGITFVVVANIAYYLTEDHAYLLLCVQGISGVLFCLKVLCLYNSESLFSPTSLFEIFELLILLEERTFLNHLSGLITGIIFVWMTRPPKFPGSGRRLGSSNLRRQEPWTRSWGYANHTRPVAMSSRSYENNLAQGRSSLQHRTWDSITPDQSLRRRRSGSPSPSPNAPPAHHSITDPGELPPSAPPYDPQQDPPHSPIYPSEFSPPPPPEGLEWVRYSQSQSPLSSEDEEW